MDSLKWWHPVAAVLGVYTIQRALYLRRSYKLWAGFRQKWCLISPLSFFSGARQVFTGVNPIKLFFWDGRNTNYGDDGVLIIISILSGDAQVLIRSPELQKTIQTQHLDFEKSANGRAMIGRLGDNIASTIGEDWKRHRRVAGPAFNATTYRNVWDETSRIYDELVQTAGWADVKQVTIDDVGLITRKLAMFVVTNCGFGINMSWNDPDYDDKGNWTPNLIIQRISEMVLPRALLSDSLFNNIPFKAIRDSKEAYDKFVPFAGDLVDARERALRDQGKEFDGIPAAKDLLGSMVRSKIEAGKLQMDKKELVANSWIFLFAGHETTASTLLVTMTMLALHPHIQEDVYQSVFSITRERDMTFDDYDALFPVLSCFLESARMYPPAFGITKQPWRDEHVSYPAPDGTPRELPVPKGTLILLDIMGVGYNPSMHPNPEEFKPSRWNEIGDRDHLGFAYGPRVCLGKKFATTEATAYLSSLLRDWRIEIDLLPGETVMDARERLLDPIISFTTQYKPFPLRLVKRDS